MFAIYRLVRGIKEKYIETEKSRGIRANSCCCEIQMCFVQCFPLIDTYKRFYKGFIDEIKSSIPASYRLCISSIRLAKKSLPLMAANLSQ